MPQVVAAQVLIAKLGDHFIPVSRIAQHRRSDPAAARASEDTRRRIMADRIEASFDQRADFFDERHGTGPLALCALVDEPTW